MGSAVRGNRVMTETELKVRKSDSFLSLCMTGGKYSIV
jgi:hypothetical protein